MSEKMRMFSFISRMLWGHESDEKDPVSGMTRHDVYNVQRSWTRIYANSHDNGYLVFTRMFVADAETLRFFKFLEGASEEQMSQSVVFRAHLVSFMSAFDSCVRHVGPAPLLAAQIARKLGETHHRRRIRGRHFTALRQVFVKVLENELSLNADMLASWGRFIDFIYENIFDTLTE